ncbi:MAG: hypothetical protein WBN23_10120 [Woeseia sp.]
MVILEPLPQCVKELDALLDSPNQWVAKRTTKLFQKWQERKAKGFGIDGPGRLYTLAGPSGAKVTVTVYRYPEDYAAAVVAIDEDQRFGRILKAGESNNQQQFDAIYDEAISRLTEWILHHGSLR